MGILTDEHKDFIVRALATFNGLTVIQRMLRERFSVEATLAQIHTYDPDSYRARKGHLGKKWVTIHAATRKAYLEDIDGIPIASQGYRLRRLGEMEQVARDNKNSILAASLLEQAAKEVGNTFTNQRKVDHSGKIVTEAEHTPEELASILADRIRGAFEVRKETAH